MSLKRVLALAAAAVGAFSWAGAACAQEEVIGIAHDKQIGMQPPVTSIADELEFIHNWILTPIIFAIAIFVMVLLLIVIVEKTVAAKAPAPARARLSDISKHPVPVGLW